MISHNTDALCRSDYHRRSADIILYASQHTNGQHTTHNHNHRHTNPIALWSSSSLVLWSSLPLSSGPIALKLRNSHFPASPPPHISSLACRNLHPPYMDLWSCGLIIIQRRRKGMIELRLTPSILSTLNT